MGDYNYKVGKWGEDLGAEYLVEIGYKVLERNYQTPSGEIDLVALDDNEDDPCLVFVEVKTRTSERFGYPEEAVTRKKWLHLLNAIEYYLENNLQNDYDWRIDVIAIQCIPPRFVPDLEHFKNVVITDGENY